MGQTGRHISKELFPFSYAEHLKFTKSRPGIKSVQNYALDGGFPRYLQTKEEIVLQELFDDIVYRDVIVHNKIRDVNAARDSEKSRLPNPKKVYCVDTGLEHAVSSRRIPNDGECDFVIRDRRAVTDDVQACVKMTDKDREAARPFYSTGESFVSGKSEMRILAQP